MTEQGTGTFLEDDTIDLRKYWLATLRYWWLVLVGAAVGAAIAFVLASRQQPLYKASTTLMVGGSLEATNPTTSEVQASEKLAQTYVEIAKTRPVLDGTISALGLPEWSFTEDHYPRMDVAAVSMTQLIRISVTDTSAARAALVANEIAAQLIATTPNAEETLLPEQDFVEKQLAMLQTEMDGVAANLDAATQQHNIAEQARLQNLMRELRAQYASLFSLLPAARTNVLRVVEPAEIPEGPVSPNVPRTTVLGGVAGLVLATFAVWIAAYLDNSIRSAEDVERELALPVLGELVNVPHRGGGRWEDGPCRRCRPSIPLRRGLQATVHEPSLLAALCAGGAFLPRHRHVAA